MVVRAGASEADEPVVGRGQLVQVGEHVRLRPAVGQGQPAGHPQGGRHGREQVVDGVETEERQHRGQLLVGVR